MSTDRILSQLFRSPTASGFAGGLAGGLASGLLTSKAGRKFGKKAVKLGGIAAVGGLAYAAWTRYREEQPPAGEVRSVPAPSAPERFVPADRESPESELLGFTLLRAMIAAAKADGRFDSSERHVIYEHVGSLDLSEAEKVTLLAQLNRPVDMDSLVGSATTPEIATEIYTASLLAIDVDTPAERAYLAMLAARLGLPDSLVRSIHSQLELPENDGELSLAAQAGAR